MGDSPDWTKWGGFLLAIISALGGYVGSAVNSATEDAQVRTTLDQLAQSFHEHDAHERENDLRTGERVANIEARVQILEKLKK